MASIASGTGASRRRTVASRRRTVAALAVALIACSAFAACSAEPDRITEPTATSAPPSPSPSLAPAEPDTVLFEVTARTRAVDGTIVDLSLVGHQPLPSTADAASGLLTDFVTTCEASGGLSISEAGTPVSAESLARFGSSLMRIDWTSDPVDRTFFAPVEVIVGIDNFALIGSGDGLQERQSTDTCLNRYQLIHSGGGTFVANYESGTSAPDPTQWRYGSYGFTVPVDSGATIESCNVAITALARESLSDVEGWAEGAVGTGISCGTGFIGE